MTKSHPFGYYRHTLLKNAEPKAYQRQGLLNFQYLCPKIGLEFFDYPEIVPDK